MKKIQFFLLSIFLAGNLFAQNANVEKTIARTTSTLVANDIETFKNQFPEWNVGNLHIYSSGNGKVKKDYYFKGEKIAPVFQQYFPKEMRSSFTGENTPPSAVAAVRGEGLKDYYVLRINEENINDKIVLYELKNDRLKVKKDLAYHYQKGNRTYQLDSWMQDVNGDTRLDLIQKKSVTDANGKVQKEKTTVFLRNKKGKFKRSRKTKIEVSDYKMQAI